MTEKNYKIGKVLIKIKLYDNEPSIKIERNSYGNQFLNLKEFEALLRHSDKFLKILQQWNQEIIEHEVLESDGDDDE